MFRALICSSSGGTVCKAVGVLAQNIAIVVYTVPLDDEQKSDRNL
jgi:hypothetical protein